MLTQPDGLSDDDIIALVSDAFGLRVSQPIFLPIGADIHTAVYRVTTGDGVSYFLKLRRGNFNQMAAIVPALLHAQGIDCVMAPLATLAGQLWVRAAGFDWMLYPFFEGKNGIDVGLSRTQWNILGASMQAVHATRLPEDLVARVPRETFSPHLRKIVRTFDSEVERRVYDDPIAADLAAFWVTKRSEIRSIVDRSEHLAQRLQQQAANLVVCHADLHGWNVLVGADDELTIVDWDEIILAPKERDLMFVGSGLFGTWNEDHQVAWFYEGYGHTLIDPGALAYYRYERIVADFAVYAEQIFGIQGSAEDREEGLRQMIGQFQPADVIEVAHTTYAQLD